MRAHQRQLRRLVLRHILGPCEITRLRLEPDDYVLVTVPDDASREVMTHIARQVGTLLGHRPIVISESMSLRAVPREVMLQLTAEAQPSHQPHGMEI